MRTHTTMGAQILSGSEYPLLRLAEEIALCHHERWDGAGYPNGLRGEEIPRSSRVVAVADVFDSLTHERPYKRAWTIRETLTEIRGNAGRHFDPSVVAAMMRIAPEAAPWAASPRRQKDPGPARPGAGSVERELEALLDERRSIEARIRRLRLQMSGADAATATAVGALR